ncbi:hypothetical protein Syun_023141 [Stephania yunnanensis]|uniref:Uncharacterized protein n=1 Tax=Stephania yunnanensis TaxID=152371 RepID=A0AAP0I3A5_9MAGN
MDNGWDDLLNYSPPISNYIPLPSFFTLSFVQPDVLNFARTSNPLQKSHILWL